MALQNDFFNDMLSLPTAFVVSALPRCLQLRPLTPNSSVFYVHSLVFDKH